MSWRTGDGRDTRSRYATGLLGDRGSAGRRNVPSVRTRCLSAA